MICLTIRTVRHHEIGTDYGMKFQSCDYWPARDSSVQDGNKPALSPPGLVRESVLSTRSLVFFRSWDVWLSMSTSLLCVLMSRFRGRQLPGAIRLVIRQQPVEEVQFKGGPPAT